jgi:hypothetical protein
MKVLIPFFFCEYDVQKNNINSMDENSFVANVRRASSFVRVRPSEMILREIFKRADLKRAGQLERV